VSPDPPPPPADSGFRIAAPERCCVDATIGRCRLGVQPSAELRSGAKTCRILDLDSPGIQRSARKLRHMSGVFPSIAVLVVLVLAASATAGDAIVGRESGADIRERVIELVNVARARGRRCGSARFAAAPPLAVSRDLGDAAAAHARDMARRNFFDHRGSNGSQPKDRVLRAGYEPRLSGENIAFGPESAEEVVAGWLDSPGHCANIMDPRFEHIGVGLATGRKRNRIYWVQTFGAPRK
jgi:uncharacterized protein YkwD